MFAEREYYDRLTAGSNENSSNKEKYVQYSVLPYFSAQFRGASGASMSNLYSVFG